MRISTFIMLVLLFSTLFLFSTKNVYGIGTMIIQVLDYHDKPLGNATIVASQRGVSTWKVITNSTGYAVLNGVDFSKPIGIFVYYLGREVYDSGLSGLIPQNFIKINANVFDVSIKVVDSNFRGINGLNVSLSYSTLFETYKFNNITNLNGIAFFSRIPNGTYDYLISSDVWGQLNSGNIDINNKTYNNIVLSVSAYELTVKAVDTNNNSIIGATVYVYYDNINIKNITDNNGIVVFKGLPANRTYNVVVISGSLSSTANVYLNNDKFITLILSTPNLSTTPTTTSSVISSTTTTSTSVTTSSTTINTITSSSVTSSSTTTSINMFVLGVSVKWSDGESVAGANVYVYDSHGNQVKSAYVIGSTKFSLPPGEYIVNASLYGVSSGMKVSLFSDTSIILYLNMSRARIPVYEFKLKVVWIDGNPVDNVLIRITKSDGTPIADVITNGNGIAVVNLMGGFIYNYNVTSSRYGKSTTGWFPLTDQIVAQSADGYLIYLGDNPLPPYINTLLIIGIIAGYALSALILFGRKIYGIVRRRIIK